MLKAVPDSDQPSSPEFLRLVDVGKTYHTGEVPVPVLHDVNLTVHRGEILVIVGPSGSGKSTLMNLIGGIDTPSSGQIYFEGRDISKLSERELTRYRRENVGFVFQFYNLVPTLTAVENVAVSTQLASNPMRPAAALKMVHLENRADHFPAQLSGGEQQRTAIARAVAKGPKLLLCDEPTGALDLETGRLVLKAITDLNEELSMTVIIITHNSAIAELAHRSVRLGTGTIAETKKNEHRVDAREIEW